MPKSAAYLRSRLAITVFATALSLNAYAEDHEVRIGRYQTVGSDTPAEPLNASDRLEPMAIPAEISTRGDALHWIVARHGYQVEDDTQRVLRLASVLSAPLPTQAYAHLPASLRQALHMLLGPEVAVIIDSTTKRAVVSIVERHANAGDGNNGAN